MRVSQTDPCGRENNNTKAKAKGENSMRFSFKPQTGILVAGLLAATYAEACYYQTTSAVCVSAGTQVDTIRWNNTTGVPVNTPITASSDWTVSSGVGHQVVVSGSGTYEGFGADGGSIPSFCLGPVHFTDAAGNTASVSSWSRGTIDGLNVAKTPADAGIYEGTGGSPGCS